MKAVLISIRPKWVELIASGKKTIEVRKTAPEIKTPFKCYIYCTKDPGNKGSATHFFESDEGTFWSAGKTFAAFLSGTVIGEFTCDSIHKIINVGNAFVAGKSVTETILMAHASCLDFGDMHDYLGHKGGYGWHISDLKIYNQPRKLSEFRKPLYCHRGNERENCTGCWDCEIKRPPQSWCYVEEMT